MLHFSLHIIFIFISMWWRVAHSLTRHDIKNLRYWKRKFDEFARLNKKKTCLEVWMRHKTSRLNSFRFDSFRFISFVCCLDWIFNEWNSERAISLAQTVFRVHNLFNARLTNLIWRFTPGWDDYCCSCSFFCLCCCFYRSTVTSVSVSQQQHYPITCKICSLMHRAYKSTSTRS